MNEMGKVFQYILPIGDSKLAFNVHVIIFSWLVMFLLLIFGYLAARKKARLPGPFQALGEMLVFQLYSLTEDALDKELTKKYGPMIFSLFMFLLLCNWIGMVPHLEEPTKDLNTPLSLGIMGFVIAHYEGIRSKGIKAYLLEYCEPFFIMIPLNVIGELAKIVSISFRLFGNIMGGAIIIVVVSHLTYSVLLPPFLNAFFGIFVGAIQAFVFTMLTMVYISVQVK